MNIQIVYFSGTGCTEYVANTFSNEFHNRGHRTVCQNINSSKSINEQTDLLVICFVVHAFNAPEPVITWIKDLDRANNIPVIIISVSGGGEVTPNLACRVPIKKALKRKHFKIVYEKMLVMPSNWIIETKQVLCSKLLHVLPYKVSYIVNDILNGNTNITHPLIGNRICTLLGSLEHNSAHTFGKNIQVDSMCNGCSLCVKNCPVSNIELYDQKPIFNNKCILCLNCIYSCPQKALIPKKMKFVTIPNGFCFKDILARPIDSNEINLDKEAKGYIWLGVKRYLSNTTDMLEPVLKKNVLTRT